MFFPICETCGTQYAAAPTAPAHCVICEDDRQYVGWQGQTWTDHAALSQKYTLRLEDDQGLLGIGLSPDFGINQRALFVRTDAGNILWECVSLVTKEAVAALKALGGVDQIIISHPHFYAGMVEWSDALGGVPILLHEADRQWVQRSSPCIQFWRGDEYQLSGSVTLLRLGGHFPGSTALHWRGGSSVGGVLLSGDAVHVAMDRRHVAFMYSYPNFVPLKSSDVKYMQALLSKYAFDSVYGYTWGRNIIGRARAAVDQSFDRYLQAITA